MFSSSKVRFAATVIFVLLAALLAALVSQSEKRQTEQNFRTIVDDSQKMLEDRLDSYVRTLDGVGGFLSASSLVTALDWRRYVDALDIEENLPGILGIGYITVVETGADFDVNREYLQRGVVLPPIHPDTGRDERFVIQYIEPIEENRSALGLDISFEANRLETALRARRTRAPQLTPPINLVQADEAFSGFLLLKPYFAPTNAFLGPDIPEPEFRGWVYMPFIGEALFGTLGLRQSDIASLRVTDLTDPDNPVEVYRDNNMLADQSLISSTRQIDVLGRTWALHWTTTPAFEAANTTASKWIVLALGLAVAASLSLLLDFGARREARIVSEVGRRTKELRAKHEEAQSVIDNAVIPIFVLDATRRILSFNTAADALFGREGLRVGMPISELIVFSNESAIGSRSMNRAWPKERPHQVLEVEENEWFTADGLLRFTVLVQDISIAEAGARNLQESEARWNNALAGAQIGVFDIDLTTGLSVVSETWRMLMGVPDSTPNSDVQRIFLDRIHPDDLPVLQAADADCIKGRTERSIAEYRMRFDDGSWRWMKSDAFVAKRDDQGNALRLLGAQTDITDLRRAQDALHASRKRFEQLLQQAPVGMALVDTNGRFMGMNQALCAMTGYSSDAFQSSLRFKDLISPRDLKAVLQAISALQSQNRTTYQNEHQILPRSGPPFWGLLSVSWTTDPETQSDVYIVQINDISEKKDVEQMKSQFVATVSHELRTPLTSIKGALGLLGGPLRDQLPKGADRLIDIASSNSDRLSALVNDILDLEKISSGQIEFQIMSHCMVDLVERCVDQNLPFAASHHVRFEVDLPPAPLMARVDAQRTEQLIANLLSNACKYSDDDTVVHVRVEQAGDKVLFCVLNEGPAIPDEFKSRIFRPFSQADASDTRAKGGTGLGLNISRQIVERMGGEIGFDSRHNALTAFWFTVPIAPETAQDTPTVFIPQGPDRTLKILHLEDDHDFLEIMKKGLGDYAEIVAAPTLSEAKHAILQQQFDVIVIDWELPDGHGRDLLDDLGKHQADARVIALSAWETSVRDIRVDHEIVKSRSTLDDVVAVILSDRRKAS